MNLSTVDEILFDRAQFGSPVSKGRKSRKEDKDTARSSMVGSPVSPNKKKIGSNLDDETFSTNNSVFSHQSKRLKIDMANVTGTFRLKEKLPVTQLPAYQTDMKGRNLIEHSIINRNLQSMQLSKRNLMGTAQTGIR